MKSLIPKYILGGIIVLTVAAYAIWSANNNTATTMAIPPLSSTLPSSENPGTGLGQYKDGSYTGSLADAFYGQLQVVAVIKNGQLADITFPQYPNEPGHTIELSQRVLPTLRQEAINVQGAHVNIVSGATQTSDAFQQSLTSALAQAK